MGKRVFSAIQPTGTVTIGNYLGALRNWIPLQKDYDCLYCVADMHSATISRPAAELRRDSYGLLALYLACGVDPEKSVVFIQSHVPAHAELAWVLDCIAYVGEMKRMTQFKDKSAKHADNVNMGLMNYPVLMASDILLYNADLVPIGKDQTQHLELARNLAQRFNARYSDTFTVPEPYMTAGAKICSLQDPFAKMSKSDENENAYISLSDDEATIARKIKRAVTDSGSEVRFGEDKPAISNLLTIYSLCSGKTVAEIEKEYVGMGYGAFKEGLTQAVVNMVSPLQMRQKEYLSDKSYLEKVMKEGAEKAQALARGTLSKVYRKVGFVPRVC